MQAFFMGTSKNSLFITAGCDQPFRLKGLYLTRVG